MKKLLGILVLGLLVGCEAPRAFVGSGGQLKLNVDRTASSSHSEIKAEADRLCQSLNRGSSTNLIKTGSDPLMIAWDYYTFDCKKSQSEAGKLDKVEIASLIEESKTTCKELGFTAGTDKFADCTLKLFSQGVDLAAKNNQQLVSQPTGSNSVTIYDPRRDSRELIRRSERMLSGACTLGVNCY
tara:strand:- start:91 stop:642 length:552 start_codon:yes stop_codon:yes gene_type:complete